MPGRWGAGAADSSSATSSSSRASSASSGSTSLGGSSSGSGSNSSSSSGSSSGTTNGKQAYECYSHPPLPDGGACPNGSFASQLLDLTNCDPIPGATVQALDANGVPAAGTVETTDGGTFLLCGPPSAAFTPFVTAPGYPTTYLAELHGNAHSTYLEFGILSSEFADGFFAILPGGVDTSLGLLVAYINTSATCGDSSGWQISLTDSDGGAIADGGFLETYLGASGIPDPSLTATTDEGIAIFYDVDSLGHQLLRFEPAQPGRRRLHPHQRAGLIHRAHLPRRRLRSRSTPFKCRVIEVSGTEPCNPLISISYAPSIDRGN